MIKSKIIIIQPACPDYRITFFKMLAKQLGGISILHFGDKSVFSQEDGISEIMGDIFEIGGFKYLKNRKNLLDEYDIIITMFDPHYINLFLLPFTYTKKKIIFWGHGFGKNKLINLIREKLVKKVSALITYSEKGKNDFLQKGICPLKIFVAHNSQFVENLQNTSRYPKNSFLFVGRLQRRKKVELLLEAFKENRLEKAGYKINIIGDGSEEEVFLKKKVNFLNLDNCVNFIAATTNNDELLKYFKEAFAYVSPGHVGLGVLHSFAFGVPVLTIKSLEHAPEVENIIHNYTGYIAENTDELAAYMKELIDINNYQRMGNNAFEHYKNKRSISNMVKAFEKAVNSVK